MKTTTVTAALAALLLCGWAWAGSEDTNQAPQALRLELDLTDGSRVIGVPAIESVPVQTAYAKMDIPLKQILAVKMDENHETASLDLVNGDRIKGAVALGPLKLATVFGDISLGVEHIHRLRVCPPGGALPETLRKNVVLCYFFDRDDGDVVTDRSRAENNGAVRGPRFTADGKSGGALWFDGVDDYLDAGNSPSLHLTRDFTLAAWIRPERTQDSFGIITKSYGYPEQHRRGIEFMLGHDDTLSAYFWDESTRYFSGVVKDRTLPRQEWTHVVLLHDSALPEHQMRAFINGVPCPMNYGYETVSSIPVVRHVAEPLRIGCMRPGTHHFKGRMDGVMIFNRTLSAEEVNALYEAQR
jgi:hypothetical protein